MFDKVITMNDCCWYSIVNCNLTLNMNNFNVEYTSDDNTKCTKQKTWEGELRESVCDWTFLSYRRKKKRMR